MGWRLALSVGLAWVRASGRRGHQGGGGVRLEGAARAGDRAGGPLLIGQADTAQAGQIGQAVAVIVGAARQCRGRSRAEDGAKEKARAGGAVCALLLWLCFSAGVVVPGGGGCPGAVVVLIRGRRRAPAAPAQFQPPQFQPEPFQGGTVSPPLIRQNAAGRRGQILHFTAYRPIGNGELGSMPPYYPP